MLFDLLRDMTFWAPEGEGAGDGGKLYGNLPPGDGLDPKEGEAKGEGAKEGEPKDGEPKEGEAKEGEAKDGEPKEGEAKEGESKDGESKEGEVPEKYEIKLPEGWEISDDVMGVFTEFAKEAKLTQESAQALAEFGVEYAREIAIDQLKAIFPPGDTETEEQYRGRLVETLSRMSGEEFKKVRETDPEIGGSHWDEAVARANLVLAEYGSEKLRQDLKSSVFGNHPELVRMLAKLHKQVLGEGKFVEGRGPGKSSDDKFMSDEEKWAAKLYPKGGK